MHHIEEGKHIVLFYEELEYAKMISFQFIKYGLVNKKDCSYLSEEDVQAIKREMSDSTIDVKKFTQNNQLHIYQVPSLTNYRLGESRNGEGEQEPARDTAVLSNASKIRKSDRIVLRCVYKINTQEQIKSNLKWEHDYRFKNLKRSGITLVSSYPINDIIPTISDSGPYGKWMNTLLETYDGVIFARKFWKGVAF
ncbi:MAG TPA: MEDS domain-containing protein, partial [Nitrososphaeraceae archaeon]|nr:MEDS domain-containing protein [Nitrososphaeraceae archaeon]